MADREFPPVCDECGEPVRVICLLADVTPETQDAIGAVLLAAHKKFHELDRADREAVRRMNEIGPIA